MERSKKPAAIPVSPLLPSPQVTISDDSSRVSASLPTGERVEVLLHGATVISWKSANGKENLFMSSKAVLDGSKPVRGGIPLVFPNFGPPPATPHPASALPQHGFARSSRWEYLGKTSSESSSAPKSSGKGGADNSITLDFGLSDGMLPPEIKKKWNYSFNLTYSVTLDPEGLETTMVVRNTGEGEGGKMDFQVLYHGYWAVEDITTTTITGLTSAPYIDKTQSAASKPASSSPLTFTSETDRIYSLPAPHPSSAESKNPHPIQVLANNKNPVLEFTTDPSVNEVVVWNPWVDKAKGMSDFGPVPDGYKKMVCVEPGSVKGWVTLEAGEAWEGGCRVKALG